jgi:hypothetical protein
MPVTTIQIAGTITITYDTPPTPSNARITTESAAFLLTETGDHLITE